MKNKEGQHVPKTTFRTRRNGEWVNVSTREIFSGKKVILFALPGAFTPTCSSTHLPRYEELAPKFKKLGVDEIVCLSVNDAFVMNAWGKEQAAKSVTLIPDGNGEFSHGMELLVDKNDLGFGKRSWRYSMFVDDGVIKKMFIEPEKPGDPFEVSDADTMYKYLNPEAADRMERHATLFSRPGCQYCEKARNLLNAQHIEFDEIVLGKDISGEGFKAVTGQTKAPQVYIDGEHIGGSDALEKHLK